MRRRQHSRRHPRAPLHLHLKLHIPHRPIPHHVLHRHHLAIHHQFHGHLVRLANPRPLHRPIRLLVIRQLLQRQVRRLVEQHRRLHRHLHASSPTQLHILKPSIHAKVHQVRPPIAQIAASLAQPINPLAIRQRRIELHIRPAQPHPVIRDAGKICLPRNPRPIPDIQRVIPDTQLPHIRRIAAGNEIDRPRPCHIHHILVRPDAVKPRHLIARHLRIHHLQSPSRMRIPGHRPLLLRPLEHGHIPGRPILQLLRARIILLLQPQQRQMPAITRRKPRDLQVIMHHLVVLR